MDATEQAIVRLATEVRRHLIQPDSDDVLPDFNISLLRVGIPPDVPAPAVQGAVEAVLHDPSLTAFRPAPDGTPVTLSGSIMGIGMTASRIPSAVVGAAAFDVAVTTGSLTEDAVVARALNYLHQMRQIAAGEAIDLRVFAGLSGFTLPEGTACSISLGTLRAADPRMGGEQSPWTIWLSHLSLPPTVVLATTIPYHVDIVRPGMPTPNLQDSAFDDVPERVLPARLALLLASDAALPLVRPRLAQFTAVLPHGGAFSYAPPGETVHIAEPRMLTDSEINAVARYAGILAQQNTQSIEVALTRTLSAATERRQPADILIDAVTAWENLVGTDIETSFRVTGALAQILEPNFDLRRDRYKALRKIYTVRSKVVHGEKPSRDQVQAGADAAVATALDALRVVLTDESWLLGVSSSQARADAVLLGDPRLRAGRSK